jgi:hypothetical protein
VTSPPRPRRTGPRRGRHTTGALFAHDVARLVVDALAAGLDPAELAVRLRAAADRLEGESVSSIG